MEEAIFIKNINDISSVPDNYRRIYFGEEFCENKIPSLKKFKDAYDYTYKNNKYLTIVFPYLPDKGLSNVKKIIDNLEILSPGFEIVANDWGTIHFIKEKYPEANVIVGRLLNKIKRDPRIKTAEDALPKEIYDLYKCSNLLTKVSQNLLSKLNIKNIEFDCPMHGVRLKKSKFNYSVHYPFGYITTTRLCINNKLTYSNGNDYACNEQCCQYTALEYKNKSFPCRVFQKGNTVFYYNNMISKEQLAKMGFKRIISHREL
ncbi:MAG: hypothetical protein IJH39_03100 [Clostridia bacterium]|nr:hypothetical protein [Clostridia bacterium]